VESNTRSRSDSRPTLEAESWPAALATVRYALPDGEVTVPKWAEPSLPDIPLRRANVPLSVHKGAWRVYREDERGPHVQIREYADHWTVELDRHNPRYRPVRHLAVDTPEYTREAVSHPVRSLFGLFVFGPLRGLQLAEQVTTTVLGSLVEGLQRGAGHVAFPLGGPSDAEPPDETDGA
jgi:hypothetical protein